MWTEMVNCRKYSRAYLQTPVSIGLKPLKRLTLCNLTDCGVIREKNETFKNCQKWRRSDMFLILPQMNYNFAWVVSGWLDALAFHSEIHLFFCISDTPWRCTVLMTEPHRCRNSYIYTSSHVLDTPFTNNLFGSPGNLIWTEVNY